VDSLDKAQLMAGLMAGLIAGLMAELILKNDIFDSNGLMIALFACVRGQLTQPLNYLLN
jgi:hypothetical protein